MDKDFQVFKEFKENSILDGSISNFNNIFPTYISEKNPKFLEIDDQYIGGLIVYNYSNKFTDMIFKNILDSNLNISISIFIEKKDKYKAIKELTYFITNSGASLKDSFQNSQDIDLVAFSYNDAKYIRKELQVNNEELFNFHTYLTVSETSPEKLRASILKLENICGISGLYSRKSYFRELYIFKSSLPISHNSHIIKGISKRNILSSSIPATFPFIFSNLNDKSGILLGLSRTNNSIVMLNRFNKEIYKNSNMCIFGSSGSGKSYFIKLNILREFLLNTIQYVIDPENEYSELGKFLGGTIITLSPSSDNFLNVFDIYEKDFKKNFLSNKLIQLKPFFHLIFQDISNEDYGKIENLIIRSYNNKGLTFEDSSFYSKNSQFKTPNKMPILEDLYLEMLKDSTLSKYSFMLIPFIKGSLNFFNHHTTFNTNSSLIIANISELGEENYKYGMCLFATFFWNKLKQNRSSNKLIYIDEIWRIIGGTSNPTTAQFIYKIFKTIRKLNGGAVSITQDVSDMLSLENRQLW